MLRVLPEYQEFTKLMYGSEIVTEIRNINHEAFSEEGYDEELEAERLL